LIFPHHECEAALSGAATGRPLVRHWAHTGMVGYQGAKMSKSLGNLVFVRDLLKTGEPVAIRLAVLAHHYRSDWEWHDDLITQAATRLASWRAGQARLAPVRAKPSGGGHLLDAVRAALDDDLDTPRAIAAIDAAVASSRPGAPRVDLSEAAALLGVPL